MTKLSKGEQAKQSDNAKVYNSKATSQECVSDLQRLQAENPLSEVSRDFYRLNGTYSERTYLKHFARFSSFKQAAGLSPNKMQRKVQSNVAHQSHLDVYRQFALEEVMPCVDRFLKSPKDPNYPEIAVISDIHDVHCDPFILATFIRMCELKQPDIICLNGDIFDNYEASTKYNIDLRQFIPKERFDFVQEHVFGALRKACPNAQIDFIVGNHDLRVIQLLATMDPFTRAWLSDCLGMTLSDWFGLSKHQINLHSKFDLAAFNSKEIKEQQDENFKVYYDCWVANHTHDDGFGMAGSSGHIHRPGMIQGSSLPMGSYDWMTTGCAKKPYVEIESASCR